MLAICLQRFNVFKVLNVLEKCMLVDGSVSSVNISTEFVHIFLNNLIIPFGKTNKICYSELSVAAQQIS